MNYVELAFFGFVSLLVLVGGVITVGSKNPIRSAMGLLTTIVGIAGMYLLLSAEFLAVIQIMVYAGAVVVLFLFVIMLLGPSATSDRDTRGWSARDLAAGVIIAGAASALALLARVSGGATTKLPPAPRGLGTVDGLGGELFGRELLPFELSSALLLVAVVGAVAVARGRQADPTLAPAKPKLADPSAAVDAPAPAPAAKEHAS